MLTAQTALGQSAAAVHCYKLAIQAARLTQCCSCLLKLPLETVTFVHSIQVTSLIWARCRLAPMLPPISTYRLVQLPAGTYGAKTFTLRSMQARV